MGVTPAGPVAVTSVTKPKKPPRRGWLAFHWVVWSALLGVLPIIGTIAWVWMFSTTVSPESALTKGQLFIATVGVCGSVLAGILQPGRIRTDRVAWVAGAFAVLLALFGMLLFAGASLTPVPTTATQAQIDELNVRQVRVELILYVAAFIVGLISVLTKPEAESP